MSLVEVLVVLALIGTVTGAAGLAIGRAERGSDLQAEARLLAARLHRAADEALLTGDPVALVWDADGYRFEVQQGDVWVPHPVPILAAHRQPGPDGLRSETSREGRYVVSADLRPLSGEALTLYLAGPGGEGPSLRFDGISAEVRP